jgi:hypothetical protein
MKRKWTEEEEQFLRDEISKGKKCREIAKELCRSVKSVQHHFNTMGLEKPVLRIGDKVNRLLILSLENRYEHGQNKTYATCLCDCGNTTILKLTAIKQEAVKSCGCLRDEKARERTIARNYKHGKGNFKVRLYRIWCQMRSRCYHAYNNAYPLYGQRGIRVCDEWKKDYEKFESWAINNGYSDNLSIDRIDVNGNYEPSNCRWATMKEQCNNRRNTLRINAIQITAFGETKTMPEWLIDPRCKAKSKTTLCYRLGAGWQPEIAITKESERP